MAACSLRKSFSKAPPFSLVPKRSEAFFVILILSHLPSPFFMKQQFLPRIGISSAAFRQHQSQAGQAVACPIAMPPEAEAAVCRADLAEVAGSCRR